MNFEQAAMDQRNERRSDTLARLLNAPQRTAPVQVVIPSSTIEKFAQMNDLQIGILAMKQLAQAGAPVIGDISPCRVLHGHIQMRSDLFTGDLVVVWVPTP